MRMLKALLLPVVLLIAAETQARTLQQVLNQGTLRVGVAVASPWTMRVGAGELAGFEIDVANRLAADMGVAADIIVLAWDRLIPALESGEIDLIAAGLAITPERALHVNFSQPYADGGISIATRLASTAAVETIEHLNSARFRAAAVEGTAAAALARRLLPAAELILLPDVERASAALVNGEVDVYLEELPVPTFLALEHPTRIDVPVTRPLLTAPAGFAINKGDPDFLAFLNAWVTARRADTWLPSTHAYWFESLQWRRQLERQGGR
jgi:polar amino acid transport system substrate-binding protein